MWFVFYFDLFAIFPRIGFGFDCGEVYYVVSDLRVFETHVLSDGALGAIGLLTIGNRTNVFAFDFAGTSPHSFFFIFQRVLFLALKVLYQCVEIVLLFLGCFELCGQHCVGEMKLISFFLVEIGSTLHISFELIHGYCFIFLELFVVPLRVAFKMILLALE